MLLNDALILASDLLAVHLSGSGWQFKLDNAKKRGGYCNYRSKTISISRHYVSACITAEVRNMLLHEIAHALTGPGVHHGPKWKQTALAIGCDARRLHSVTMSRPAFVGECPKCQFRITRHRRRTIACSACCAKFNGGKYDPQYKFVWSRNTEG
jgi:predicted SprT family Zn-dependent metalloprotease